MPCAGTVRPVRAVASAAHFVQLPQDHVELAIQLVDPLLEPRRTVVRATHSVRRMMKAMAAMRGMVKAWAAVMVTAVMRAAVRPPTTIATVALPTVMLPTLAVSIAVRRSPMRPVGTRLALLARVAGRIVGALAPLIVGEEGHPIVVGQAVPGVPQILLRVKGAGGGRFGPSCARDSGQQCRRRGAGKCPPMVEKVTPHRSDSCK
jgi:hypothetical protein